MHNGPAQCLVEPKLHSGKLFPVAYTCRRGYSSVGGIVNTDSDNKDLLQGSKTAPTVMMPTVRLGDLLDHFGAPSVIDYFRSVPHAHPCDVAAMHACAYLWVWHPQVWVVGLTALTRPA